MPETVVRRIEGQEAAEIINWLSSYAFSPTPPIADLDKAIQNIEDHEGVLYHALFEGGKAVASYASKPMTQNIRGKLYPMAGIFKVSTHPGARRKGYIRQLAKETFDAVYAEGKVVSCLYPFRESFYQRMGYVTFPLQLQATIQIRSLLPLVKQGYGENLELMTYQEGFETYNEFVREHQIRVHGMTAFDHYPEPKPDGANAWMVIAKHNGQIEGMMLYRIQGKEVTKLKFNVQRFYAVTPQARYHLLGWIGRHVDQASEVEMRMPGFEKPNTWLADLETEIAAAWIAPMGRIINVEKLSGMQVGPGRFSARIIDEYCPWNERVWTFESKDDLLHIHEGGQADCDLSIQGLSALIYGVAEPTSFALRDWGNPDEALQTLMLKMFPPAHPHLHEYF